MQVDILVLLSQHIGPRSNNWQDHKLSSSLGSLSIRYWSLLCGTLKVPNCWFLFLRVSPRHRRVTQKSGSLFGTPLKCSYKFGKFLFSDEYLYRHVRHWARRVTIAPIRRFVGEWTSRFSHECGPRTWRTAVLLPSCMFPWGHRTLSELFLWPVWRRSALSLLR